MTRKFCPDYGALSTPKGYLPMHAWFADDKLKVTLFKGERLYFPTAAAARQAAKDFVTEQINGRDRAQTIKVERDPLADEAAAYLARRERAEAEERARVFGEAAPSTVFPGKGRPPVKVETRRRRVA